MRRLAIYDFCETIANFQTANAFIEFIIKHENTPQIYRIIRSRALYSRLGVKQLTNIFGYFSNYYFDKFFLLRALKGMARDQIEAYGIRFYDEVISHNLIEKSINCVRNDIKEGLDIIVVSASYEPVLKPFCESFGIKLLITNLFEYDSEDRFTGKIIGKDCIGKRKVDKLKTMFRNQNVEYCKSYSDSKSDIPILTCSQKGIVISKNQHQKWIDRYSFEELIWK